MYLAHRYYYELEKGEIPKGLVLDHLCRNRSCINVNHLEPVTQKENVRRATSNVVAQNMSKTHCKRGHEFGRQPSYIVKKGWRACSTCHRDREQIRRMGLKYA